MARFKVGDKVRCVKASNFGYPGVVGEVLTVRYVDGAGLYFKEVHHTRSAAPNRFELVVEAPTAPKEYHVRQQFEKITVHRGSFKTIEEAKEHVRVNGNIGTAYEVIEVVVHATVTPVRALA